jgi:hypothetical protein
VTERRSKRPTVIPSPTAKSGQHPAVQAYRAKLESISEGSAVAAVSELDSQLEEFLRDLRTPIPPPPTSKKKDPSSKT